MFPRKRARPNPSQTQPGNSTTSLPADLSNQSAASLPHSALGSNPSTSDASTVAPRKASTMSDGSSKSGSNGQVRKSRSWYGSFGRKSSASTQVARENIMGGTLRSEHAPDFSRYDIQSSSDGATDTDARSIRTLSKITENNTESTANTLTPSNDQPAATADEGTTSTKQTQSVDDAPKDAQSVADSNQPDQTKDQEPASNSGWLGGWFGRTTVPQQGEQTATVSKANEPDAKGNTLAESSSTKAGTDTNPPPIESSAVEPEPPKPKSTSSWFGLWSSTHTTDSPTAEGGSSGATAIKSPEAPSTGQESQDTTMEDAPPAPPSQSTQPSAGSTWAFWSRDSGNNDTQKTDAPPEQGELAVIGDGSEASPRRSAGVDVGDDAAPPQEPPSKVSRDVLAKSSPTKKSKRVRPQSMDLDESPSIRPGTPQSDSSAKTAATKATTPNNVNTQNLVLPSFKNTYRMKQNPSIIKQIAQMLLRTQQPPANHVFLVKDPPRIRKAVAIGVHGLFPASFLRPMIGQPTGTSIRFVNHCAEAIRKWADAHGCGDCEIEKIALEGEGKIAERVDNLWKLLLNWIEHIRRADLIVLACHSQGVPVGLMLVAKLIDLGIITSARIGICAMAGVSLGPFPDYKSGMGMLMSSGAELWQFADPESEVTKQYEHALEVVINYGGRITYVGSIDDQLVPMESAIYSPLSHPYVYRAVFIDGRVHAPDFIAHLVGFALKLRNLGISDHGLIRELSIPLAGSLYSGEGHSRIYDEEQVYELAVSHALETSAAPAVPFQIKKHEGLTNPNPYILPWIMRGLLEEEFVRTELYSETAELLNQFDHWKPTTKALKDVKYRLEAVRSKL